MTVTIKITFSLHAIVQKDCLGYLKFDPMNTFMTREQNSLVTNWPAAWSQGSINKPPAVGKGCSSSMNSISKGLCINPVHI